MRLVRRRAGAVLLTLVLAAALLAATRTPWLHAAAPAGPGRSSGTVDVTGSDAAALVPALALVGIAGALALSVGRRVGSAVAGVLVAAAGLGAVAAIGTVLAAPARAAAGAVRTASGLTGLPPSRTEVTAWPFLAAFLALALAATGAAAVAAGRRWAGTARFEAPAARDSDPSARDSALPAPAAVRTDVAPRAALWDELSRGGDPTDSRDAPGEPGEPDAPAAEQARTMGVDARSPEGAP